MLKEIYFVTGNKNKVREVETILNQPLKVFEHSLDEIQSLSLEEIARKKATEAFKILQKPLLVEDAGLFFKAWNGFPGPFVKHLLAVGGNELILKMLGSEPYREASARAAFGFHDGRKITTFVGEVAGLVSHEVKGKGWGWDAIFIPEGSRETYAEMGEAKKNLVSHRRAALEKLKDSSEFLGVLG